MFAHDTTTTAANGVLCTVRLLIRLYATTFNWHIAKPYYEL